MLPFMGMQALSNPNIPHIWCVRLAGCDQPGEPRELLIVGAAQGQKCSFSPALSSRRARRQHLLEIGGMKIGKGQR